MKPFGRQSVRRVGCCVTCVISRRRLVVCRGGRWRRCRCADPDLAAGNGRNDRDAWLARGARLGVVLMPADRVERIAADLPLLSLIACSFPGPSEGRGYSQARSLRERWKFTGELRATGYVRRDQLFFLARSGFNSFELPTTPTLADASSHNIAPTFFCSLSAVERCGTRAQAAAAPAGYTCQRLKRRPTFCPTLKRSPA